MPSARQGAPAQLKPGARRPARNGPARERSVGYEPHDGHRQLADVQRARMLAAMVEVASERGAANATVARVVARSGVSRRTFYEIFEDREDCFLAACEDALQRTAAVVLPAYEEHGSWRARMRAALSALLACLDSDRATGRLLIVETLGAGPRALQRRRSVLSQIAAAVDRGRSQGRAGTDPPPLTAEGIVGGVLSVLHARLAAGQPAQLAELSGPLMGMIVLPYLGSAAARREVDRPAPKAPVETTVLAGSPLMQLDMRLTYRTVRVLMAIAAQPGSSNRGVGDASGITDQGQISKLLSRLHGLGLIQNAGGGATRGEPNAWTLTGRGWDVQGAIAAQIGRS